MERNRHHENSSVRPARDATNGANISPVTLLRTRQSGHTDAIFAMELFREPMF